MVELGIYHHYKGYKYKVIANGLLEATQQPVVVYQALYDNPLSSVWVRPEQEFLDAVHVDGKLVPRFSFISKS